MAELKEVFEMVTKQTEPDLEAWNEQERRQRRAMRGRKVGALAMAAALFIAIGIFALASIPGSDEPLTNPDDPISVPPVSLGANEQDVAVVDLEGQPVRGIPGIPEDAYGLSLSNDGMHVAFVTGEDGADQIATIGVDGSNLTVLHTDVTASTAAWSPDGSMIAFEGAIPGSETDIYVVNADGSDLRRLTTDPAFDQYPQWSPDGATIVYNNSGAETVDDPQFSPTSEIWSVPATGGEPTRLTFDTEADAHPSYAPTGERIAYFHDGQIWLMDPDGSNKERLISEGGFTPRWSPDGTMIAYTTYSDEARPNVEFGAVTRDAPLVLVNVVVVRSAEHHRVGDVGMATDLNTPQWWSNDELLIRRVGY